MPGIHRTPTPSWPAAFSDRTSGLTAHEADDRRRQHGPNEIASEPGPSTWAIALQQLKDLMNLMLVAVAIVSVVIGEVPTAIIVAALVVLNVVLGTRQELKARASVDALAKMQTPQVRATRDGALVQFAATDLVPGDTKVLGIIAWTAVAIIVIIGWRTSWRCRAIRGPMNRRHGGAADR